MKKKSTPQEPCQHWSINLAGRSCEGCIRTVVLPGDAAAKAQADRDTHNADVIGKMQTKMPWADTDSQGDAQ